MQSVRVVRVRIEFDHLLFWEPWQTGHSNKRCDRRLMHVEMTVPLLASRGGRVAANFVDVFQMIELHAARQNDMPAMRSQEESGHIDPTAECVTVVCYLVCTDRTTTMATPGICSESTATTYSHAATASAAPVSCGSVTRCAPADSKAVHANHAHLATGIHSVIL